jgi:hypothetical protein
MRGHWRFRLKILLIAFGIALFPASGIHGAVTQPTDREIFDRKLYSIVPFRGFGTNPKQFAELSEAQKQNLLAGHDVLAALFQAIDSGGDVSIYLTPEVRKHYRTSGDFIAPETSLMDIGILDWKLLNGDTEIQLQFATVVYSEGDWVLSKNAATLTKTSSGWRIAKLDLNQKDDH